MNTQNLTTTERIAVIEKAYHIMSNQNSFRSFLNMGREALEAEWFSARGISEKLDIHYTTFFKRFFDPLAEQYAGKLFTDTQIEKFTVELAQKLNGSLEGDIPVPQQKGIDVSTVVEVAQPTKIEMKKEQASASFNLMLPLSDMINTAVTDYIENESGLLAHVDQRIIDEAKKLRPTLITIGERKPVEIAGRTHVTFERALKKCIRYKQTFIAGPAGTGKTTLASQIAKALELPYGHISCTAGMSEAHLLGRMDANGNYLQSEFVNIYENGGVFLFDEIDAADSNTMLIINSALANGHMSIPNRKDKPFAKRHENFYCIAAANTWGFGSNEYAGRNVLDAATLDRFAGSQLFVDYDLELEKEISKDFPQVAETIQKIRENVKANRMRRVVSTRAVINGVVALSDGDTLKEYICDFLIAWTDEEKKKALLNVSF